MGDPLQSFLSLIIEYRERFSFHTLGFFWGVGGEEGRGVICKNIHFDITGTLVRAPLSQTLIAEQQPHVLIVSTHH